VERWGWNDAYANVQQQGLYFLDRPHVFKLTAVYELPFGKGKKFAGNSHGIVDKIVGGWEFATFYLNQSGTPVDLPNMIQLKDPKIGYESPDWKAYKVRGWSPCVLRQYNDGTVKMQQFSIDAGCGTDPSTYSWLLPAGYSPRYTPYRSGQIRRHHAFTMDASLLKTIHVTERLRAQLGFEAFNVMNHNYYGRESFNTNGNDANFGTVMPAYASTQNGFPRQIQVRLKAFW
jgi:hypothetical protein